MGAISGRFRNLFPMIKSRRRSVFWKRTARLSSKTACTDSPTCGVKKRMVFRSIKREPATSPMEEEAKQIIDSLAAPYQEVGGRWPKERRYSRMVNVALVTTVLGLGYLIVFTSSFFTPPA